MMSLWQGLFLAVILGLLQPFGVRLPIIVEMPLGRMWLRPLGGGCLETHHASTGIDLDMGATKTIKLTATIVCKGIRMGTWVA